MRTFIIGSFMIFTGLVFGVALTEVSLRTFMPELAAKTTQTDDGYIKNLGTTIDAKLNAKGFREDDGLADLDDKSWFVIGGSTAFGVNVKRNERLSEQFENLTGIKVYNAALQDADGDMAREFETVKKLKSKANKVSYVLDLGIPPHVWLGEEAPKTAGKGFLQNLVLTKVLTGNTGPKVDTTPAWTEASARKFAKKLADVSAKYRNMDEHFILPMAPARGYYYENSIGSIHRKNQKLIAEAVRQYPGLYAIDLTFLIKLDYSNPDMLFDENNRYNKTGQRMIGTGFLKQFEAFTTWKSFDELTEEEKVKVLEDMRKTQEEEARKKAQMPF